MANITRFDPVAEMNLDPFGDDFFRGLSLRPVFREFGSKAQMRLDMTEDDKGYVVKAEIPGVKKEDIRISIDGNQVSISAELKKEKHEKEGERVIRSERFYGSTSRSFSLGQDVDEKTAQAKYNDGILELTLPKKTGGSKRVVPIS